ncbi:stromal cell-derived factor 2-like protein [Phtheirospermum japonicum]|uniref:Stromal cell-derived factor 2-like protein n=1 Tax=Phtheirospermum japonicum TaxID=374723 RepID=A0A830BC40_9LAMI|nr:stromal cell-derived factor 2-like protein [Phtheirospermum japonicum]
MVNVVGRYGYGRIHTPFLYTPKQITTINSNVSHVGISHHPIPMTHVNKHPHGRMLFAFLIEKPRILLLCSDPVRSSGTGIQTPTVAPSHQQGNLTRRKSAPPPVASSSGRARIVYRESVGHSSDSDLSPPFWQSTWFIVLLLVMAVAFFGLAIFLLLTLDSDYASAPVSAASEGVQASPRSRLSFHTHTRNITYGSVIKLMHEKTKFRLHSHDVPYGSGSGQQSVTGFPNVDDSNSYWIVRPTQDSSAKQGDAIKSGELIKLQHMKTRKWLHSHLHASPISGNLEVSCFGNDGQSDTGDYWRLEIEGSGKTWRQDQRIRLRHVDTGGYLHTEGVYLPVAEGK